MRTPQDTEITEHPQKIARTNNQTTLKSAQPDPLSKLGVKDIKPSLKSKEKETHFHSSFPKLRSNMKVHSKKITSRRKELQAFLKYVNEEFGSKKKLSEVSSKLVQTLKAIQVLHQEAKPHEKRQYLSLVSQFEMKQLQSIGFSINSHSFANARKHSNKIGPGKPVLPPNQPPSKKPISEELKSKITQFLKQHSKVGANRTVSSTKKNSLTKEKKKK